MFKFKLKKNLPDLMKQTDIYFFLKNLQYSLRRLTRHLFSSPYHNIIVNDEYEPAQRVKEKFLHEFFSPFHTPKKITFYNVGIKNLQHNVKKLKNSEIIKKIS